MSYYASSSPSSFSVSWTIGAIVALICTILLFVMVLPAKKRAGLPKFFQILHDIFNFKGLLLEYIVKALYTFLTISSIVSGFCLLFANIYGHSLAGLGLLLMLLGPVLLRVIFESTMMFILLVKNVISMNNKFDKLGSAAPNAPAEEPAPELPPKMIYCSECGTRYDANKGGCPNGCKPD